MWNLSVAYFDRIIIISQSHIKSVWTVASPSVRFNITAEISIPIRKIVLDLLLKSFCNLSFYFIFCRWNRSLKDLRASCVTPQIKEARRQKKQTLSMLSDFDCRSGDFDVGRNISALLGGRHEKLSSLRLICLCPMTSCLEMIPAILPDRKINKHHGPL